MLLKREGSKQEYRQRERERSLERETETKEGGEGGLVGRCRRRLDLLQRGIGAGEQFQNSCPADVPVDRSAAPRQRL